MGSWRQVTWGPAHMVRTWSLTLSAKECHLGGGGGKRHGVTYIKKKRLSEPLGC